MIYPAAGQPIPDLDHAVTRRAFLGAGLGVGGALLVGFYVRTSGAASGESAVFAPNAFIRIDRQGKIVLIMPQVEMGQGIYTAVAMILAEELDAAFDQVMLEAAPPNDKLYANPTFGIQVTGNSNSVRAFWMPLRKAAAGARATLVQAASQVWKVDPASIRTDSSTAIHDASGRRLAYAALIDRAHGLTPPKDPVLKDPKDFKLIGKPLKRLDTPDKVNGKVVYGIDVMPPGVKFATIAACPVFGGKVGHVDDSKAKSLPGVRQVVQLDDFVAVVGDHMWAAKQGMAALSITWNEGSNAAISSADVWKKIRSASEQEGAVAKNVGDAAKGLSEGELHEAIYELPFLAHATMEPMNCTAHVTPTSCEV
jgi:isoquinoline 1-oxidoreductase beta subunit